MGDAGTNPHDDATDATQVIVDALDAPPDCMTWTPRHVDACSAPTPNPGVLVITGAVTYNTDTPGFVGGSLVNPLTVVDPQTDVTANDTPALVISVAGLRIDPGAVLRVVGTRPLIILSWDAIEILGTLDVGSSFAAGNYAVGAGANPAGCVAHRATAGAGDEDGGGGSGGGGGGAFQTVGGAAGPGDSGGQNAGGVGGTAVAVPTTLVRGGCSGAASGRAGTDASVTAPSDANTVAAGGPGGGAVALDARHLITLGAAGKILAGGAGGRGAPLHSAVGGGGGGAGGFIGLDAPMFQAAPTAVLAANGGGGGASAAFAAIGNFGSDARPDTGVAVGGAMQTCANAGGNGGVVGAANGATAAQTAVTCGGGAGGGGVGFIAVFGPASLPTLVRSPAPTLVP